MDSYDTSVVKFVTDVLEFHNMETGDLAARTGVSQAQLTGVLKGTRRLSLAQLKQVADGMGYDLHFWGEPKGIPKNATPTLDPATALNMTEVQ